ncbi:hypothetical protein [Lacrimispora sp.]|uniref:hypothetical protein n=1 Tax=Lacrimispora sp. TaxID=2719234 RepID=UPI0028AB70BA|nr:hypothetical protein [Lacrimispora sp.]
MNYSDVNGLDIYEHSGNGFQTMIRFESWRVALASRGNEQAGEHVTSLSRHLETDEVFVLLKGGCTIYTGGTGEKISAIQTVEMEPLKLYNIRKGTWHARILQPDSQILVVENERTGDFNSESAELSAEQAL